MATKQDVTSTYGVAARTVERWMRAGLPHQKGPDGAVYFDPVAVGAWAAARGIKPSTSAAGLDGQAPLSTREAAQRADVAKKIAQAKRQEHELQQEKGLAALGLDERVRSAKTASDLADVAQEVTALVAAGALASQRGHALRQLLSETRQALRMREAAGSAEDGRVALVTAEARQVAELFDRLVNGWRRLWVRDAVLAHVAADALEFPPTAAEGATAQRLAALGLDLHGDPAPGQASPFPAPTVPSPQEGTP